MKQIDDQSMPVSGRHHRWCRRLIASLSIGVPLVISTVLPAHAGWLDVVLGNTTGAATGRSQGGGIRDTRCLVSEGAQDLSQTHENNQIVALLPNTEQATSQQAPSFFLYVPYDRYGDPMEVVFELATREANAQRKVIESITLSLPDKAGLVEFQLPDNLALEDGKLYDWSFILKCRTDNVPEVSGTPVAEETTSINSGPLEASDLDISILATDTTSQSTTSRSGKVLQEVFGTMRLVNPPTQLLEAQATSDITDDYQAYVDNNMWLDLVPAVLDASLSDFELLLEQEFDLDIDAEQLTIEILEAS
ncbi:MAG: DUF928 domain-containing protein [Cyanobacteria bacterium P01_H01_bin.21]